jgi:hypothetical protein
MKKLTLLLFPTILFAQTRVEVYETVNGVRNVSPSKIIETQGNATTVYETNSGVKNLFPSQVIETTKTEVKSFEVKDGLKNLFPTQVIPVVEPPKKVEIDVFKFPIISQ